MNEKAQLMLDFFDRLKAALWAAFLFVKKSISHFLAYTSCKHTFCQKILRSGNINICVKIVYDFFQRLSIILSDTARIPASPMFYDSCSGQKLPIIHRTKACADALIFINRNNVNQVNAFLFRKEFKLPCLPNPEYILSEVCWAQISFRSE